MRAALVVWWALLVSSGASGPAQAQADPEHERIEHERAATQARFVERQRGCLERFGVTSCIEAAQRERREALTRLRREQNALDEGLRKARAARRTEAIRSKVDASAERARTAQSRPRSRGDVMLPPPLGEPPRTGSGTRAPGQSTGPLRPRARPALAHDAQRTAQEATRSRVAYDEAQRAAAAHRAEVEERAARRLKKHKPATPLPLPAGVAPP